MLNLNFFKKRQEESFLGKKGQACVAFDRQEEKAKKLADTLVETIPGLFLETSYTEIKKICEEGFFCVVVIREGKILFKIKVNLSNTRQELEVKWGSLLGIDFFNKDNLGSLFRKISQNFS